MRPFLRNISPLWIANTSHYWLLSSHFCYLDLTRFLACLFRISRKWSYLWNTHVMLTPLQVWYDIGMKSDAPVCTPFSKPLIWSRYLKSAKDHLGWRTDERADLAGWSEAIGHWNRNADPFRVQCFGSILQIQYPEYFGSAASLLNERVAFWRQQRRGTYVHCTAPAPYSGCALIGIGSGTCPGFLLCHFLST